MSTAHYPSGEEKVLNDENIIHAVDPHMNEAALDTHSLTSYTNSAGPIRVQNKDFETTTNIGKPPSHRTSCWMIHLFSLHCIAL
jgi:hypothetical protein